MEKTPEEEQSEEQLQTLDEVVAPHKSSFTSNDSHFISQLLEGAQLVQSAEELQVRSVLRNTEHDRIFEYSSNIK